MSEGMKTQKKSKRSAQGPLTIWQGMTLRQLFRLARYRPTLHISKLHKVLPLPFTGLHNSIWSLMEHLVYSRRLAQTQIDQPPLFIIGHWRSGTTLLHNLITQDTRFTYPTMYQVLFPNHFLLSENVICPLTSRFLPETRPMDNMPVGWDIPQEEDIAMVIMTCLSPYMLNARPDDEAQVRGMWDLSGLSGKQMERLKQTYLLFLKKLTLRDPRRLVLKSPVNTLRIPFLRSLFPDAKFLYIYRNPFDVFNSSCHFRKKVLPENCLGKPHFKNLKESIFEVQELTHWNYFRDRKQIPDGHLYEICFEDFEADPLTELEKVYDALQLGAFEALSKILEPQLPQLRRYKKNTFKYDSDLMDEVYERLRFSFDAYGYPHPAELYEAAPAMHKTA